VSDTTTGAKPLEAWWTRWVVDPVADRIVRRIAHIEWVTPNRITATAGVLVLAAAAAFATGRPVLGGLVFQLRFLVDCLDGRLARVRGAATTWGAALDVLVDTLGIAACYLALAGHLGNVGAAASWLPGVLAALYGAYAWTLAQRKALPGGGQHNWLRTSEDPAPTGLRSRYVAAMARRGVVPTPYALEVETLALTLVPVISGAVLPDAEWRTPVAFMLWCACGFYVVATALNVVRTHRLAAGIDHARKGPSPE